MQVIEPTNDEIEAVVQAFIRKKDLFNLLRRQVVDFFIENSLFQQPPLPLVHSVKSRIKDEHHLRDKIKRKWPKGPVTPDNFHNRITDLAGVRVLHLHSSQFSEIHSAINTHISEGNWVLCEDPIAYSWDPEATDFYRALGIRHETRDSYYTSIHYVVKTHAASPITCEIQVRTLFEEAWGEIDHAINYPKPTELIACAEQLKVLAKLASTGTRLADSIFKSSRT